jgi:4-oxalocrotonate tautomerase
VPLIEVTLAEGRSPGQIRSMMHEVHEAVLRTVDTRSEHIRVIVREVPPNPLGHRRSDIVRDGRG